MQIYVQNSAFVSEWRVRIQDDERGQFVNVHCGGPSHAYISLDTEAAVRLLADVRDALLELQRRGLWEPAAPGTDSGVSLGCPDDPVGM